MGKLRTVMPSLSAGSCECALELEDADGAKMRVHLSGVAMPGPIALSRSFWRAEPCIQITPQMRGMVAVESADFRKGIDGSARQPLQGSKGGFPSSR